MTDYTLTDEQRKMLTEFIGEEWIDDEPWWDEDNRINHYNSAFDTASDMMALRKALREKGRWADFLSFAFFEVNPEDKTELCEDAINGSFYSVDFMAYLDEDVERFCWLCCRFLEERQ